ncbi:alkaline phosphatase [Lonsdalea populi]|uniref:alkaline phosphatase n=1 Tax=Lonsdalea populi TaxID=1172565 RepID=UPI000A21BF02|nr:alkaline phosphatase [Lonsdalea populi]OSM95860.1 alkaline phosphatase [Lonsdalea populi]RAT70365.1 alkaline phosphatase [Lonsdalea populi]RAT72307.1 alkaline phosphatase [Lonsdalea populi]RAT75022.1 alkaline phosphatase [Lonsdalea populi]RAT78655.1 alkaline phosphatase [Lonsdalea populi]
MKLRWLLPLLISSALPGFSHAQMIYPIDRATMPAGGRFDFKVEFDEVLKPEDIRIQINGRDYQQVLGKPATFVEREDGEPVSTVWVRDVALPQAGRYKVEAQAKGKTAQVSWEVYQAPQTRKAKNVILFIGDGLSVAHRTGARILSKGMTEGKADGKLAIDDLQYMAFAGTSSTDSIAADSANTMSAYMTGHKSGVNAIGVYVSRSKNSLDHPKQETLGELVTRSTNMALGIVSDAELEDATPAAVVSHTRRRADKAEIASMFYDVQPTVMLGGGSAYFLPKSAPGSKRKDDINYVEKFQQAGYTLATDAQTLKQNAATATKLLGLFHTGNMDGVLDRRFLKNDVIRKFPNQPDLTDMTQAALDVLSKNKDGFFLMVESALIDKASHPLDWERAFYNTIMLDQSVAVAKKFVETHPDTLIIVTGDHTHGISIIGTVDDNKPGTEMREKVGVYEEAGYPNYQDANKDGYPDDVNVSKRLAVFFNNYPDYYETFRPKLDGTFVPSVKNDKDEYVANKTYASVPGAVLREGVLPRSVDAGVHSVDDMVIQASGPGGEAIRGYMDNTQLFRVIVDALAIDARNTTTK